MHNGPDPFPLDLTGTVIASAVREHHKNTGVDPGLAAVAAMASATAAVQNCFDVQRPDMDATPVSSLSIVCAGSGAGKSTAAKPFLQPHKDMQEALLRTAPSPAIAQMEYKAWQAVYKPMLELQAQQALTGTVNEALKARIAKQLSLEPTATVHLLHDRVTPSALTRNLSGFPSTLVASMDAGHLLNGRLMGEFDLLNALWDGETQLIDTLEDSIRAQAPRVSALLYMQPGVMGRFMLRRAEDAHDTGFFARTDFTFLPNAQIQPGSLAPQGSQSIRMFQDRVKFLLEQGIRNHERRQSWRYAVGFTADGAARFRDLFRRTVNMGAPGGELQALGGYAAKIAERTARYACVIHTFNGLSGQISAETLYRAEGIVNWHTRQFRNMLYEASPQVRAMYDAQVLESAIQQAVQRGEWVQLRELPRLCPVDWNRKRSAYALRVLEETGRACVRPWKNTKYIQLTQSYPGLGYGGGRASYHDMR